MFRELAQQIRWTTRNVTLSTGFLAGALVNTGCHTANRQSEHCHGPDEEPARSEMVVAIAEQDRALGSEPIVRPLEVEEVADPRPRRSRPPGPAAAEPDGAASARPAAEAAAAEPAGALEQVASVTEAGGDLAPAPVRSPRRTSERRSDPVAQSYLSSHSALQPGVR
jgi:hypothetical protein